MNFTLDDLASLTSARGEGLLARLADADLSDAAALPLITSLRRDYTARESSVALELARLRQKAVGKFGTDAARMFFTADALEQASHPAAKNWRLLNLSPFPPETVLDVCSSIGADALVFAAACERVTGIDLDADRVEIARLNAAVLHKQAHFEVGDARNLSPDLLDAADLVFFDPGRRNERGRVHHVEGYEPPLSTIRAWGERRIWIKLSPGVQIDQLDPYRQNGAMLDFISADGELKEAMLRLGETTENQVRAVIKSGDGVFYNFVTYPSIEAPLDNPRGWLVEPDPAIIRAGSVAQTTLAYGGALLDEEIAYFTTETKPDAPFMRAWRIREWMPFHVKRLREVLRQRAIGHVTVKKRGTAVTPEVLIPQLKLNGENSCTLVLTRLKNQQIVMVCDDLETE